MSGTAMEVAPEMRAVYGLDVVRVPTHRPMRRHNLGVRVFRHADERWRVVADSARALSAAGRAVLIGTRSVDASDEVSRALSALGLPHALLNARQDAEEAAVIAEAGQPGRITVATNMAGRGTDILLHDAVRAAGGLHVILTEFHESSRVDRQLQGRAGRQGDPGSFESLVSLDDALFIGFGGIATRWLRRACDGPAAVLPAPLGQALRRFAQWRAEALYSGVRRRTVEQDRELDRRLAFGGPTR
jgi:preprotein translocase subunit SecA